MCSYVRSSCIGTLSAPHCLIGVLVLYWGGGGMHLCNISKPNRLEKLSFGVCPVSHFALGKVTFTGPAVCSSCCVQSPKYPLPICMGNIRDCMERQEALKKAVRDCVESSLNSPTGGDYSLQL